MNRTLRGIAVLVGLVMSSACGSDTATSSATPPRYLAVAGTYQVTGTFDQFTAAQAQVSGSVIFVQVSRDDANLTGTSNIVARIGTSVSTITGVYAATIGDGGIVTFTSERLEHQHGSSPARPRVTLLQERTGWPMR